MRKINTLFVRDETTHLVTDQIAPGCEWALAGEGKATQKFDGTACLVQRGFFFKRREINPGGEKPFGFRAAGMDNGKIQGWMPVERADVYHMEAYHRLERLMSGSLNEVESKEMEQWKPLIMPYLAVGAADFTCELCGPKVQSNPERLPFHLLIPHGCIVLPDCPRDYSGLREYMRTHDIEGVVFWGQGGKTAKIKARDFGLVRGGSSIVVGPVVSEQLGNLHSTQAEEPQETSGDASTPPAAQNVAVSAPVSAVPDKSTESALPKPDVKGRKGKR